MTSEIGMMIAEIGMMTIEIAIDKIIMLSMIITMISDEPFNYYDNHPNFPTRTIAVSQGLRWYPVCIFVLQLFKHIICLTKFFSCVDNQIKLCFIPTVSNDSSELNESSFFYLLFVLFYRIVIVFYKQHIVFCCCNVYQLK